MPQPPAGGQPLTDPFAELRQLLAPDACRELVEALFLIRQKTKRGKVLLVVQDDRVRLESTVNSDWYP